MWKDISLFCQFYIYAYDIIESLWVFGEDVLEDTVQVVLLSTELLVAGFDFRYEAFGDDAGVPVFPVDFLWYRGVYFGGVAGLLVVVGEKGLQLG